MCPFLPTCSGYITCSCVCVSDHFKDTGSTDIHLTKVTSLDEEKEVTICATLRQIIIIATDHFRCDAASLHWIVVIS